MSNNKICLLFITIFFTCCNDLSELERNLIEAGKNRRELESVIQHYKDDTLKSIAAKFLIENMKGHLTYTGTGPNTYYKNMDSIIKSWEKKGKDYAKIYMAYDSVSLSYNDLVESMQKLPDLQSISADFLIEHIDQAFSVWNQPWNKDLDFDTFCNYVLPYRICKEPLSNWRKAYLKKYENIISSRIFSQSNHTFKLGILSDMNRGYTTKVYIPKTPLPDLPLASLLQIPVGSCEDYSMLNVAQLRSLGIPCAREFVPGWGNRSMSHSWTAVLLGNEAIPFGLNERIGIHFYLRPEHKLPKVYRETFKRQKWMNEICDDTTEFVPNIFVNRGLIDVTDKYTETSNVIVRLFDTPETKYAKWVYLSVFNNQSWTPVAFSKNSKKRRVNFSLMGRGIVYLPCVYDKNGNCIPAGNPVAVELDGSTKELDGCCTERTSCTIFRKYPQNYKQTIYCKELEGAKFQASNTEDFRNPITLATVGRIEQNRYYRLIVSDTRKFKFFRFLAQKDNQGNIAEIEVFDKRGIRPDTLKTFGSELVEKGHEAWTAFDGNVLTSFCSTEDKAWTALEFKQPTQIHSIRFLPRNDGNIIEENDIYQLFVWGKTGWKLLFEQKGNRDACFFLKNMKTSSLYLLHNQTKGSEERIFTVNDRKQVFW